jgi:receptor protein-tyrosine kinase
MASLRAAGLVAPTQGQGRSKVLEEIAMVQHQVLRLVDAAGEKGMAEARVVLIASALPHEGKSFVALNLAASIAASAGRAVLLVDTDGRGESLSRKLNATDGPGLRALEPLMGPWDPAAWEAVKLEPATLRPAGSASNSLSTIDGPPPSKGLPAESSQQGKPKASWPDGQMSLLDGPTI